MKDRIKVAGRGWLCCWNADGTIAWRKDYTNGLTYAGLGYLAGAGLCGGAQITTWYSLLIDNTLFNALNINDTMSSHAGWREFTGYSGNRPQWVNSAGGPMAASNGPFTFPITANGLVTGLGIVSNNTVGGSSGTLYTTAEFSPQTVTVGQSLTGTYYSVFSGG